MAIRHETGMDGWSQTEHAEDAPDVVAVMVTVVIMTLRDFGRVGGQCSTESVPLRTDGIEGGPLLVGERIVEGIKGRLH